MKLPISPPGSLTCSANSTVTRNLGSTSHPKDYSLFYLASRGFEPTTCSNPNHCVHESYALPTDFGRLKKKNDGIITLNLNTFQHLHCFGAFNQCLQRQAIRTTYLARSVYISMYLQLVYGGFIPTVRVRTFNLIAA